MTARSFSTRLNSFGIGHGKKYPDESWTTVGLIAEAAKVKGLTSLELNYPEHFVKNTLDEVKEALAATHLDIKGIQLRWPSPKFSNGGFANNDESIRRAAIETVKEATGVAREFGTDHVLLWPAHDGYEYPLQLDYVRAWKWFRDALIEIADENPEMRYSIEYKPAEPRGRTLLNTTGAVLKMLADVNRVNVGVTLDFGHLLMAGENPAQSAALCLQDGRLFGLQLNDSHGTADDGLLVGSIHLPQTIELAYYLLREDYQGTYYFDTDPVREDPIRECEMNIVRMKHILAEAEKLVSFLPIGDALASSQLLWEACVGS